MATQLNVICSTVSPVTVTSRVRLCAQVRQVFKVSRCSRICGKP